MNHSLEMPVTDRRMDGQTYGWDQIYRTPVGCAGGPASGGVSIGSFAIVIGAPIGITSATLSHAFSWCTELVKKLLKATRNKKKKHNKIVTLARSKLNSIENKTSEALINNQISHPDFITIINEERNYRELKESIGMMRGQEGKK